MSFVSNQFQLNPPGKPLDLILCAFEPAVQSGVSINRMISKLDEIGYNTRLINQKLFELGFEEGMSSRNKTFILRLSACHTRVLCRRCASDGHYKNYIHC